MEHRLTRSLSHSTMAVSQIVTRYIEMVLCYGVHFIVSFPTRHQLFNFFLVLTPAGTAVQAMARAHSNPFITEYISVVSVSV